MSILNAITSGAGGVALSGDTSGNLIIQSAGTNVASFTTGGNLVMATGGIQFSANPGGGASGVLNDYEVGTWTPTLSSGSVTIDNNWYVKVGKMVTVATVLSGFSDRSTASQIVVSGLPFAAIKSTAATSGLFRYCNSTPSFYATTSSTILMYVSGSAGYGTFNYSALNNASAELYINITYQASV